MLNTVPQVKQSEQEYKEKATKLKEDLKQRYCLFPNVH